MAKTALWTFEGFVTAAGNKRVQEWYRDEIGIGERDDIRDRVNYLGNVGRNLWKGEHFKWLGEIGEIRKKTPKGALRIYGYFPQDRPNVFIFLNGTLKKSMKDNRGIDAALDRLKVLKQGRGTTHGFNFEEEPSREDSAEQRGEEPPSSE